MDLPTAESPESEPEAAAAAASAEVAALAQSLSGPRNWRRIAARAERAYLAVGLLVALARAASLR